MAKQDVYLLLSAEAGWFNPIRHWFENGCVPVIAPFPTTTVGANKEPAFLTDITRLSFEQKAALADALYNRHSDHPQMNATLARELVRKGVPILARWVKDVVGDERFVTPDSRQWAFEFNQFSDVPSIDIQISPLAAWTLIAQIQVASRHPGNNGAGAELIRSWASELEARMNLSPFMKEFLAKGWDRDQDIKVEAEDDCP